MIVFLLLAGSAYADPTVPVSILNQNSGTPCVVGATGCNLPVSGTFSATQTAFAPGGSTVSLSAGTTSSNVSFGSTTNVGVSNTGSQTAFVAFGTTSGVTATTSNYPILAGQTVFFAAGSNTYIAAITSTSATTLFISPGTGLPAITGGGASSGGGGGAVTASSGAYVSGSIADLGPYTTSNTVAYYLAGLYNGTATSSSLPIYFQSSVAAAGIQADSSAFINPSTAITTQIVGLSSGKKIYVTSFDVVASSANTVNFSYGTGTNCAGGLTAVSGTWSFAANGGIARGSGIGPVIIVPAGNALCVTTGQSGQVGIDVSYTQF